MSRRSFDHERGGPVVAAEVAQGDVGAGEGLVDDDLTDHGASPQRLFDQDRGCVIGVDPEGAGCGRRREFLWTNWGAWTMYGEAGSPGTTSKLTGSDISGPHAQGVVADDGIAGCRELKRHPVPCTDVRRVNVDESHVQR